jgi:hypothetical protein
VLVEGSGLGRADVLASGAVGWVHPARRSPATRPVTILAVTILPATIGREARRPVEITE